jgi:hypothetical protein
MRSIRSPHLPEEPTAHAHPHDAGGYHTPNGQPDQNPYCFRDPHMPEAGRIKVGASKAQTLRTLLPDREYIIFSNRHGSVPVHGLAIPTFF